ncbi:MAG: AhpC/TSA family protein [Terriglobales bacterium]
MREKLSEFEARGVRLACVVQGTAEEAARFCGRHGVEQICIPDPEKQSYRAMGFPRTTWGKLLFASPELKQRRRESGEAGCSNNLTGALQEHSDVFQLPGAALIARGGSILWLHRGQHPGDVPLADGLLEVVQQKLPA